MKKTQTTATYYGSDLKKSNDSGLVPIVLLFLLVAVFFAGLAGFAMGRNIKQKQVPTLTFYDGEGNEIPANAVTALVRDQYVQVSQQEKELINRYFYFEQYRIDSGFIYVREPNQELGSEVIAYPQDSFSICRMYKVN